MKPLLRYREDGTFTIVQFTDVHWKNGDDIDARSRLIMSDVVRTEQPDLIVYTGDTIFSTDCSDPAASFRQAVSVPEEAGIPWAAVFGNHDAEQGVTREELMASLSGTEFGLSEAGPEVISGVGNYVLSVQGAGDNSAFRLYFLDSGDYAPDAVGGYGWVKPDQIAWYTADSKAAAQEAGAIVPALAFFHIPLPEYDQLWNEGEACGIKKEQVCCAKVNSGLFSAMLDRGDVVAAFAGHDHLNDYGGSWHGIGLYYGRATGCNTYGFEHRGARVIRLREGSRQPETWIRLETGERINYTERKELP